jgi:hypothetical protein
MVVLAQGLSRELKAWLSLLDPLTRLLTYITGLVVLAVDDRPQCLPICSSPQSCLSVLTTWWLASHRVNDTASKAESQCLLKAYFGSHCHCFNNTWVWLKSALVQVRGGYTRVRVPGGGDHQEPSWTVADKACARIVPLEKFHPNMP